MEKDYTKQELENKKVAELKEILRNRNLRISGKKEELIEGKCAGKRAHSLDCHHAKRCNSLAFHNALTTRQAGAGKE